MCSFFSRGGCKALERKGSDHLVEMLLGELCQQLRLLQIVVSFTLWRLALGAAIRPVTTYGSRHRYDTFLLRVTTNMCGLCYCDVCCRRLITKFCPYE